MTSIKKVLDLIATFSNEQKAVLMRAMSEQDSPTTQTSFGNLEKSMDMDAIECPHCASPFIKKFGNFNGRKRYRCGICRKTFTCLTKTPISSTKYPEKWDLFVSYCVEGFSLRKIADKLDIHVATAFDWRHKLMNVYTSNQKLTGIAEADETFFLYSEKGSRSISNRRPRKRGGKAKTAGISSEQVPVIVGKDRQSNLIVGVAGKGRVSAKDIGKVLETHIDKNATLCTDAHPSFKAFAKANNLKVIQLNISKGKRVLRKKYHIQNVNNAHSSMKRWMAKFNGVSTKYLQNYMNWFCLLEETKDEPNRSQAFALKTLEVVKHEE